MSVSSSDSLPAVSRKPGFSLVELLVVIAIISIVATVSFAAFAHVREGARRETCASNERQLTLALAQYTQDNNDVYPNAAAGRPGVGAPSAWIFVAAYDDLGYGARFTPERGSLYPYVKNPGVYVCPDDMVGRANGDSYAYNGCLTSKADLATSGPGILFTGKSAAHFTAPSVTLAFGEEDSGREIDANGSTNDGLINFPGDGMTYSTRHDGGSNVSMLDGHVRRYPYEKLIALDLEEGLGETPCSQ